MSYLSTLPYGWTVVSECNNRSWIVFFSVEKDKHTTFLLRLRHWSSVRSLRHCCSTLSDVTPQVSNSEPPISPLPLAGLQFPPLLPCWSLLCCSITSTWLGVLLSPITSAQPHPGDRIWRRRPRYLAVSSVCLPTGPCAVITVVIRPIKRPKTAREDFLNLHFSLCPWFQPCRDQETWMKPPTRMNSPKKLELRGVWASVLRLDSC